MPIYEYVCKECKHEFIVSLSLHEAEMKPTITCPHCNSPKVEKKFSAFTAKTSKKS
ncbi:MAG: zinc ribbon domain-containing protein [Thermodesulfovibrionales bacterium]|nr:zinc ribbon domain-containing protein [Thermodesulfovibrionales bacterium]